VTYPVEYAQSIYETQVKPLPAEARAELDAHVKRLESDPFPGKRVFRLRVSGALRQAGSQPIFAARSRRFIVFHTVLDNRVVILGVFSAEVRR